MQKITGLILAMLCLLTACSNQDSPETLQTVWLNESTLSLQSGKTFRFSLITEPEVILPEIRWYLTGGTMQNETGNIDTDGLFEALTPGNTTVYAELLIGSKVYTAQCAVTVTAIEAEQLVLSIASTDSIRIGDSIRVQCRFLPENTTIKQVNWHSSDASVLALTTISDTEAWIKGVAKGEAIVQATSGTAEVTKKLQVVAIEAQRILIYGDESLELNYTYPFVAQIIPLNATDTTIRWSSSNSAVASIDENGQVRAAGIGSAEIRATASNGVYASVDVTVNDIRHFVYQEFTAANVSGSNGYLTGSLSATLFNRSKSAVTLTSFRVIDTRSSQVISSDKTSYTMETDARITRNVSLYMNFNPIFEWSYQTASGERYTIYATY